jgi:hypothetical protein
MALRTATRVALARAYLSQCWDDNTTHVHGLEMALVAKVVTFEELDLEPAMLQRYLLQQARRLAMACKTERSIEAALSLNCMLLCKHWCQGLITCKSVDIELGQLDRLLRRHAISVAKQCLDDFTNLEMVRDMIVGHSLTAKELDLAPDLLQRILAGNDPPSRP